MSKTNPKSLTELMEILWADYTTLNPQVKKIHQLFTDEGEEVVNDHVAFRTFSHPDIGIDAMEKVFLKFGYRASGEYEFTEKKLYAKHYENSDAKQPKIFISELLLNDVPLYVKSIASDIINHLPADQKYSQLLCTSGRSWKASYDIYQKLKTMSEYAAWVYAFGFRVNHFTVLVNPLKKFLTLKAVNNFLKDNKVSLNTAGGEIKGSEDELLEQSSTLAFNAKVDFDEGTQEIPACYYEFAKRYPQPSGRIYNGFIAKSADKIFESTNKGQR